MRVLLIEDDPMLGRSLVRALQDAAMSVDWIRDGHDADAAVADGGHTVILLDINLPGKSGLEILSEQRRRGIKTPILVLTARDGTQDRVDGLDLGADDYLVKPFAVAELLARIRAVIRRQGGHTTSTMGNGRLEIDLASHVASMDDISVVLPAREFALLRALLERPGTILSRGQLEERIYGWGEEVESNAVEALIYAIRKKFGKGAIRNLRGAGWMVSRDGR